MGKSRVFTGVIWASIQRFGTMIISFVTNIVLARLLTPDDFGTIGMLFLFLAIASTFVDSGFGSALIQKKDANETDFSTVFLINLGLSIVLYSALFFVAPWVARFYNVDILRSLLRVQGIILILNAFSIIQTTMLRKKMDFRKLSICNLVGNVVGSFIGILAAIKGYGVWSLVIRTLVVAFVTSLSLWIVGKWKPLGIFSKQSFKELFGFGGFMLLSSIVYTLTNNIQTLVMGKLFTPATLGNYTQARQLRNVASESVSSVVSQVFYPDLANNQNNNNALFSKLVFGVQTISFFVIAMMLLCILVADPLIKVLYGEKWIACIPYFQILCVSGLFLALQDVNINVIAAKGRSRLLFFINVGKLIAFVLFMIIGAKIGGEIGLIWGINLYSFTAWIVFASVANSLVSGVFFKQLISVTTNILLAVIPFVFTFFVNRNWSNYLSPFSLLIINASLFTILYFVLSLVTKNKVLYYVLGMIKIYKQ